NPRVIAAHEAERVVGKALEREYALTDLLRRPNVSYAQLMSMVASDGRRFDEPSVPQDIAAQVEIQVKYAGYIDRQAKEVERHEHYEHLRLPADIDYQAVPALSFEVRQKLNQFKPETLGQASRIAGVTPAAISLLLIHLKKRGFATATAADHGKSAA
ncbi:MAG: tRNA uridine-5-carboxymethylaminomethyl(34) synthesis enzyme MnmG, partial [Betaproteobacteria bacterium]|nr:tRNA uridine-5-carboxymethylaminomethyl(34) synthesis enzyme MnmG [Betaproteobacteria bacterium]